MSAAVSAAMRCACGKLHVLTGSSRLESCPACGRNLWDQWMSAPSPRCGRLDDHEPHEWLGATRIGANRVPATRSCPGHVVTEGGQPCVECQRPTVACRCEFWRAEERAREWDQ